MNKSFKIPQARYQLCAPFKTRKEGTEGNAGRPGKAWQSLALELLFFTIILYQLSFFKLSVGNLIPKFYFRSPWTPEKEVEARDVAVLRRTAHAAPPSP